MNLVVSAMELISILVLHNVITGNYIFEYIERYLVLSIIISIIILPILNSKGFTGGVLVFLILFVLTVYVSKLKDRERFEVFCELCIAQLTVMIFQFVGSVIMLIITNDTSKNNVIVISMMIGIFFIIVFLDKRIKKKGISISNIIDKYSQFNVMTINLILAMFVVKTFTRNFDVQVDLLIQVIITVTIIICINIFYFINIINKRSKDKKEEINENINPLIDDLINKMKAREHEYKNHLNILYCMIQVAKEDELRDKAKEYIGNITSADELLSNITSIDNTIIKAILFNKAQVARKLKIDFTYNIESDMKNIDIDDSELTVLLLNLLNNAMEGSSMSKDKYVELDIYQEDDQYIIYIKNSVDYVNESILKNMFKEGYSTKGDNRGYGLLNIKSVLAKCNGKIYVELVDSFIEFTIEIPII